MRQLNMHAKGRGKRTGLRGVRRPGRDPHARLSRLAPLHASYSQPPTRARSSGRYCPERRMERGRIGLELTYCSGELRLHLAHEAFHRLEQLIEVAVAMEIDLEG